MSASHSHVAATARDDTHEQHVMAMRLMQHPGTYTEWEIGHSRLMQQVCEPTRLRAQLVRMRALTLRLIHRRAVFEYLRDRHITGAQRHRYVEIFYGPRDYATSLLLEHGHYTRSRVSASCSRYIGTQVLRDSAFDAPLAAYEQYYGEYFRMFCDLQLATAEDDGMACEQALLPLLKQRCDQARERLIRLR
ncbi:MAG TPA: hypothetical protein VHW25_02360 [Steroidobacteraceae bacterium]|nr:hypothetical protein [Steroidobacteraceae bacterium]